MVNKSWKQFLAVDAVEDEMTVFRKHVRTRRPLGNGYLTILFSSVSKIIAFYSNVFMFGELYRIRHGEGEIFSYTYSDFMENVIENFPSNTNVIQENKPRIRI